MKINIAYRMQPSQIWSSQNLLIEDLSLDHRELEEAEAQTAFAFLSLSFMRDSDNVSAELTPLMCLLKGPLYRRTC